MTMVILACFAYIVAAGGFYLWITANAPLVQELSSGVPMPVQAEMITLFPVAQEVDRAA